jgi:hypothetical protein
MELSDTVAAGTGWRTDSLADPVTCPGRTSAYCADALCMSWIDSVIPGEDGAVICVPLACVGPGKTSPIGDVANLPAMETSPDPFDSKRWASVDVNILIGLVGNAILST